MKSLMPLLESGASSSHAVIPGLVLRFLESRVWPFRQRVWEFRIWADPELLLSSSVSVSTREWGTHVTPAIPGKVPIYSMSSSPESLSSSELVIKSWIFLPRLETGSDILDKSAPISDSTVCAYLGTISYSESSVADERMDEVSD